MAYDIVGDIHGQSGKLIALLNQMGYRERQGAWRHPSRTVLFVGDFVDRGPGQLETLNLVRRMIDAGSAQAVMGNHEFNAIAWHTTDARNGGHLRPRNFKNRLQHAVFLGAVGEDSHQHAEWVRWFMTLPLWLELPGLRIVHACWHPAYMAALKPHLGPGDTLTPELVEASSRPGTTAFEAVEGVVKGLEIDLPSPVSFVDANGHERRRVRVRWWDTGATTYRTAAILDGNTSQLLPQTSIPATAQIAYDNTKPVFFGHYWQTGTPRILSPHACCVDYSAARDGQPLVAYRWDGEPILDSHRLMAHDSKIDLDGRRGPARPHRDCR